MSTTLSLDEIIKAKKNRLLKQKKQEGSAKKTAPAKKVAVAKASGATKSNGVHKKVVKQEVVAKKVVSSNGAQQKQKPGSGSSAKPRPLNAKNITIQVKVAKPVKVVKPVPQIDAHQVVFQISTGRTPITNVKKTADEERAKRSAETKQIVQNKRDVAMANARKPKQSASPTSLSDRFSLASSR